VGTLVPEILLFLLSVTYMVRGYLLSSQQIHISCQDPRFEHFLLNIKGTEKGPNTEGS
jgi:hypothetical protein